MSPSLTRVLAAALLMSGMATAPALAADEPAPAPLPAPSAAEVPAFDPGPFALRQGQLTLHQGFGLATLVAMGGTATLGLLAHGSPGTQLREAHLVMAGLTSGLYLTSATLSLTVPPPLRPHDANPWSSVSIHEKLAWVHAFGMLGTVATGAAYAYGGPAFEPYHEVMALGTLGWMALSAGAIAFLP